MSKLSLLDEARPSRWRKGERIANRFEIFNILGGEGKSGMGIVYICYDYVNKIPCALKTFQDKYLVSKGVQEQFEKEALVWTHLGNYPYIVRAYFVEKLAGRLFIVLEYVAPDESGRNTLTHYLSKLSFVQTLKFAIQFCYGMEYAYSKGIYAHRDIKPDNIMITSNQMLKITDFGLAKSLSVIGTGVEIGSEPGINKLSIFESQGKGICGTPPWMAPEQFDGYADKRSDIYAFGCVLYQMVSGSKFSPFIGKSLEEYEKLHKTAKVPPISSPIFPIVEKCLEKDPESRYQDFTTIREELQVFFEKETGEIINPPKKNELEAWEHSNKGGSLQSLGFYDEAIWEYREALRIDPTNKNAHNNLGFAFREIGHLDESISEYCEALSIDPEDAATHTGFGNTLSEKGYLDEAIREYHKALMINPVNSNAHYNLGLALAYKGHLNEAISEYREALKIDPGNEMAHTNIGNVMASSGHLDDAITEYYEAMRINPHNALTHYNLGLALVLQDHLEKSILEFREALRIDPGFVQAHYNLGLALKNKGLLDEAIGEYREALRLDPYYAGALYNLGIALQNKGYLDEAITAYGNFIKYAPPQYAGDVEKVKELICELKNRK